MRRSVAITLSIAAIAAGTFAAVGAPPRGAVAPLAGAAVKVLKGAGHGSGVHIGAGAFVTAAHVVGDETTLTLQTDTGEKVTAVVVWANKSHDVALLRAEIRPQTVPLSCRDVRVGETVHAVGNPGPIEFVTTWGRVAATAKKRAPWDSAFIVDGTVAQGMSGGPVLDDREELVGITAGMAVQSDGFMGSSAIMLNYVVPGSALCRLLAR